MNSANSEISGSFGILTTALSLSNRTRSVISTLFVKYCTTFCINFYASWCIRAHIFAVYNAVVVRIFNCTASCIYFSASWVLGHWSTLFRTPSLSSSMLQPFASTRTPAGVIGHWSLLSTTPSLSLSLGAEGVLLQMELQTYFNAVIVIAFAEIVVCRDFCD